MMNIDAQKTSGSPNCVTKCDEDFHVLKTPEYEFVKKEFRKLMNTSRQLFVNLRDLPPHCRYWKNYFHRTFDVYTKLWKYQRDNRSILEDESSYGLKRWEIGEIASKIGQLYYHYYLRTSDTKYLGEAFVFYDAIRSRKYLQVVKGVKSQALYHKKLRYYARFVVTCILLGKFVLAKKLICDMKTMIEDPNINFVGNQKEEWNSVMLNTSAFIDAINFICPFNGEESDSLEYSHSRLDASAYEMSLHRESAFENNVLNFREAILVCCYKHQERCSELTVDLYRMIHVLEISPYSINCKSDAGDVVPHKYILFCPSIYKLIALISSIVKDMLDNSMSLLYISARGSGNALDDNDKSIVIAKDPNNPASNGEEKLRHLDSACLYPFDLSTLIRKSCVIIIESSESFSFQNIGSNTFGKNYVVLMSPEECMLPDPSVTGSPISMFLYAPSKAFYMFSGIRSISRENWKELTKAVYGIEKLISSALVTSAKEGYLDPSYVSFMGNRLLFRIFARFAFMCMILERSKDLSQPKHYPKSAPPFPQEIFDDVKINNEINRLIMDLGSECSYNLKTINK